MPKKRNKRQNDVTLAERFTNSCVPHQTFLSHTATDELLDQLRISIQQERNRLISEIKELVRPILTLKSSSQSKSIYRHLTQKLDRILKAQKAIRPNTRSTCILSQQDLIRFSPKEIELCRLIRNGMPGRAIAAQLGISFYTVQTRIAKIRKKLGIRNTKINLVTFLRTASF